MNTREIKLCLVGCSPSSGSTYLADLLDSSRYTLAGPEIGFLANPIFYSKEWQDILIQKSIATPSPHSSGVTIYEKFLSGYGLNNIQMRDLVCSSNDCVEFLERFVNRYVDFREKNQASIFFEKTPQNIFIVQQYLSKFSDGHFIYIARNPIDVVLSLRKRGYSSYTAALSWFVAAATFLGVESHRRTILIKYEALLKNPYDIISDLFFRLGKIEVSSREIEFNYWNNTYRRVCESRLDSWSIKGLAKNKPKKLLSLTSADRGLFRLLSSCKISEQYSQKWNISPLSFTEVLSKLGYLNDFNMAISGDALKLEFKDFKPSYNEKKLMLGKWIKSKAWKTSSIVRINDFMTPLKIIERK